MDQEELENIAKLELEGIERKIENLNNLIQNAHTQEIKEEYIDITKETVKKLEKQKNEIIKKLQQEK